MYDVGIMGTFGLSSFGMVVVQYLLCGFPLFMLDCVI